MSQSQAVINYPVHIGMWTNRSLGSVSGLTITLTHRDGALLTAFLAIFITFTGSKFWRIVCFAMYRLFLSRPNAAQDGLYHQRQAVLRNANDEKTGFLSLARILLAWRKRAHRPITRLLPLLGTSLAIFVCFAMASIFASRISSGNEVLISSPNCGVPNGTSSDPTTPRLVEAVFNTWSAERVNSNANYAQRCYSSTDRNSSTEAENDGCTPFVKKQLNSIIDRNATCPFHPNICRNYYGNIRLDTGYLNAQRDIGLNLPSDLDFTLRKVSQCAPLKTKQYQRSAPYSSDKNYTQYFYGPRIAARNVDFTYQVDEISADEVYWRGSTSPYADYRLNCNAQSSFTPVQELAQNDADITLVFLSANGVKFTDKVDDAWYAAHHSFNDTPLSLTPSSDSTLHYLADEPASVLGCTEQYQICDPTLPPGQGCSPLRSGANLIDFDHTAPQTKRDWAIYWTVGYQGLQTVIKELQSTSLTARFGLEQGLQPTLPANQWQLEVENWHNILLSTLQGDSVETAIGPANREMLRYFWTRPSNDIERFICKNHKIISTAYTNILAVWLIVILVVGVIIITIEQLLERIVMFLERRKIIKSTTTAEWIANGTLQLQRMAHEELGLGDWEGCGGGGGVVPVTRKGQLLGVFLTSEESKSVHTKLVDPKLLALGTASTATDAENSSGDGKLIHDTNSTNVNGLQSGTADVEKGSSVENILSGTTETDISGTPMTALLQVDGETK
ncbi:MAG: hypothetical protein Q9227_000445 [Pyrenula ochraceoflavens]